MWLCVCAGLYACSSERERENGSVENLYSCVPESLCAGWWWIKTGSWAAELNENQMWRCWLLDADSNLDARAFQPAAAQITFWKWWKRTKKTLTMTTTMIMIMMMKMIAMTWHFTLDVAGGVIHSLPQSDYRCLSHHETKVSSLHNTEEANLKNSKKQQLASWLHLAVQNHLFSSACLSTLYLYYSANNSIHCTTPSHAFTNASLHSFTWLLIKHSQLDQTDM